MDTLIIQDVRFEPNINFTDDDLFMVEVVVDGKLVGASGATKQSALGKMWPFDIEFLVPTISDTFSFKFYRVDGDGERSVWGGITVAAPYIIQNSGVKKRGFEIQLQTSDESADVGDIGFSGVLSTSNYSAKPSPLTILEIVKNMSSDALISFLVELVQSDVSCVNADTAIIQAIHGAVSTLPDEGIEKPRALTLLANVLLVRYDLYLQIAEEEATAQPMYLVYLVGLKQSLHLFENAIFLATSDHPKKTWMLHSFSLCIQRFIMLNAGNVEAFQAAIFKLRGVVSQIPDFEPQKSRHIVFLAEIFQHLFTQSNDPSHLDNSIAMFENAIRFAADDKSKASLLTALAELLMVRFNLSNRPIDISMSLLHRSESLRLIPDDDVEKPVKLNFLGHALFLRSRKFGDIELTMKSIEAFESALLIMKDDPSHPEKPSILNNLAASLQLRSEQLNVFADSADERRTREVLEDTVSLSLPTDPNKVTYLLNFGRVFLPGRKLRATSVDTDFVAEFVSILRSAFPFIENDVSNALLFNKLAYSFLSQYDELVQLGYFDDFVDQYKAIISLLSDDNADKASSLYQLASAISRSQGTNSPKNISDAILIFESAVLIRQGVDELNVPYTIDHGTAYLQRFDDLNDFEDLNKAIAFLQRAVNDPRSTSDHRKLTALNDLAWALFSRFHRRKNLEDIDAGALMLDKAAFLTTSTYPEYTSYRSQQFNHLVERFDQFPDISDVDIVILALKAEVDALAADPPMPRLHNLGTYLSIRLKRLGGGNLPQLVSDTLVEAIKRIPDSLPRKPMWLNMAGDLLLQRFKHTSEESDLSQAINIFEHAIQLTSDEPSPSFEYYNRLGCALRSRFHLLGNLRNLNKAINLFQDALRICPEIHDSRHSLLINFAASLLDRYLYLGDILDFNQAALTFHIARDLNTQDAEILNVIDENIAVILTHRTEITGDLESVNKAIDIWHSKSESTTSADTLCGHANSLLHRFRILNDVEDVDAALELINRAQDLVDDENSAGHRKKTRILHLRASALSQRFVRLSQPEDIDGCITFLQQAAKLTPDVHPLMPNLLFDLGRWLPVRFDVLGNDQDLDDSFTYLSACASSTTAPIRLRFRAASLWAYWLKQFRRGDPMFAYTLSMDLLPQLAWLGHSIAVRHSRLLEASHVALNAVAAAIEVGQYNTAIEWLEAGRCIVWSQLQELRSPVEGLSRAHPDLAAKFEALSKQLEGVGDLPLDDASILSRGSGIRYHDLAHERNQLIDEIRALDGFESFLRPKRISDFIPCAQAGPIITINISQYRCDALVLVPGSNEVRHIPLEQFSAADANRLLENLRTILRKRNFLPGERGTRSSLNKKRIQDPEIVFEDILSKLWTCVAKPVLDGIGIKLPSTEDIPRVWWCLTGPLASLPLHAAGLYRTRDLFGSKLSDFVTSSYIPSISSLLNNMRLRKAIQNQILAIALPIESELPRVMEEIDGIKKSTNLFPILSLVDAEATLENVIAGIQTSSYVHFACHGVQGTFNPIDTALLLSRDTQLSLSNIAKLNVAHGELAYLSACQTATGDDLLAEQSIHLAAGLLSAGYRSVIGTMWSISDDDAPTVAEQVYRRLLQEEPEEQHVLLDSTRAAYALALAVKHLRTEGPKKSFFAWVPFIHMGS
ncbi:hypothetical protein BDN70DRAFT_839328 [Pholiota conissans]|uniref:CHAT domain-containing protein n=1 Tax=Pholiota conissans TaxID=109636 RepID=A0A9P5YVU2_9AGAR|nr:hypothetical protein BDN70DRAFT_839328 [Pholiota conissans]